MSGCSKKSKKIKCKDLPVGTWWDNKGNIHIPEEVRENKCYSTPQAKQQKTESFWDQFAKCKEEQEKLDLLRTYAETVRFKRTAKELKSARRGFETKKKHVPMWFGPCKVCGRHADVRHHIIQLQNGGRNKKGNIMNLCFGCHAEIHPWLKEERHGVH